MQIQQDIKLDFDDVILRPMPSDLVSRADVNLVRTLKFKHSPKTWSGIPIIASNMDTIGTLEMYESLSKCGMLTALHKFYTPDEILAYHAEKPILFPSYLAISTGIREADIERLFEIKEKGVDKLADFICIDVPNGYIKVFHQACIQIREIFPEHIIIAGNIVTDDVANHLIMNCGVDIIKVGIGPGSRCTTRKLTGVGYPQLSAIIECANASHQQAGHLMADGGCKNPSDVAKAFCAGADFVMLGGMFAGHDECAGNYVISKLPQLPHPNAQKVGDIIETTQVDDLMSCGYEISREFYGMSSKKAMITHYGEVAEHRAPEGRSEPVPYKGPVINTVLDILGGVRSCATYIGAHSIKQMHKRATFVRVVK